MLCLLYPPARIRELDKNLAITDLQIHIIIARVAKKRPYKTTRQYIRRLVEPAKVFCLKTLPQKYLCHLIVKHIAPVIQKDCNKPCGLANKVY